MRYDNFAIERNKKWLVETAMKSSTPKRLAGHLFEASEQITQLQQDLKAQIADVQEVRHGEWDDIRDAYGHLEGWIHRDCGRMSMAKDKYCPNCGTKMDGGGEDSGN